MIYIHFPFCRTRCVYCGFYSERATESGGTRKDFLKALCSEIASCEPSPSTTVLDTLYIGGGTPSLMDSAALQNVAAAVCVLREKSGLSGEIMEFTLEANPDDILRGGPQYVADLRAAGVNRVSLGVQSFDDAVLKRMGRRHSASAAGEAYALLREGGVTDISIDVIFGFAPGLDEKSFLEGLETFCGSLPLPDHISCYQLSVEEGSGLEKMLEKGLIALPDDDLCSGQYDMLCVALKSLGYGHYEISNWALPGHRARHNSAYWDHTPYIGFGPGAHSLLKNADGSFSRRWNLPDLKAYLDASVSGFGTIRAEETLSAVQFREEEIMLGLRTSEGVPASILPQSARVGEPGSSGTLERIGNGRVRIPESSWFISDYIISGI